MHLVFNQVTVEQSHYRSGTNVREMLLSFIQIQIRFIRDSPDQFYAKKTGFAFLAFSFSANSKEFYTL